jgi:hypothetical protein
LAGLQLTLPSQTVELLDRPAQAQTPVSLGPLNQPRQAWHAPVSTLSEPCWEPHRGTPIPFTKWTKNRIQEPSRQRICSENKTVQSSDAPGMKKLSAIPPKNASEEYILQSRIGALREGSCALRLQAGPALITKLPRKRNKFSSGAEFGYHRNFHCMNKS